LPRRITAPTFGILFDVAALTRGASAPALGTELRLCSRVTLNFFADCVHSGVRTYLFAVLGDSPRENARRRIKVIADVYGVCSEYDAEGLAEDTFLVQKPKEKRSK
jgi:hypothetical protein